jgi:hypothetical protein
MLDRLRIFYLLKLQSLQNKVVLTIDIFLKCTPVRELHMPFQVPYIYDYKTKLCRQLAEIIQNHENANVHDIGKSEARHRKYKGLSLAAF